MTRNVLSAILLKSFGLLVALLVSRQIIVNYGDNANGFIAASRQILSYLSLMEIGLSGSVLPLLYKASKLADRKTEFNVYAKLAILPKDFCNNSAFRRYLLCV